MWERRRKKTEPLSAEEIIGLAGRSIWGDIPSIAGLSETHPYNYVLLGPLIASGIRTGDPTDVVMHDDNPISNYLTGAGIMDLTKFIALCIEGAKQNGISAEVFEGLPTAEY
jgi:hypothetical protein